AGEEDIALPTRQHQPRRLATRQEARIACHLPDLAEHALGGIEDREVDVGADIEDAGLHRRMLVRIVEERDDLLFLARIERTAMALAAAGVQPLDQGQQLFAITGASEDGETFRGEFLGNLATNEIAGADYRDRFVSLLQGCSPALPGVEAISPALLAQRLRQL